MKLKYDYPIIVIGAGAGGLVVAIGAAKAGKKVLLIEKGTYGGDCTNFGCIPSKSLIAAAHASHTIHHGKKYGLLYDIAGFESSGALERTRDIVQHILDEEDPEALGKMGVETLTGMASFQDPYTLQVVTSDGEERQITGDQIVIATGSHPYIPPIPGLDLIPYHTNETIFDLSEVPKKLVVIGGGPIGSELAQAFHRLGSKVTILQHGKHILAREEEMTQDVMEEQFRKEGIELYLHHETLQADMNEGEICLEIQNHDTEQRQFITGSHVLVSVGRRPNLGSLNLKNVGIKVYDRGICVDDYGRTSQKNVWAVGDVAGHAIFTHVAENEARTVLTNLLLPWPLRFKLDRKQAIPRVTFTDPEVASVGLNEEQAKKDFGESKIAVYMFPFDKLDRAITTERTEGFVKIVTKKWSSKILGATIVAPRAGEMLSQITTAMRGGIALRKLASLIHPYPTYSLAIRKCADMWLTQTVLPSLKKWIGKS